MNNVERTVDLFLSGSICTQAILTVFGEAYGLDLETAGKLARPFGGGMGHLGRTCGAVTGAVIVLGLALDHQDEGRARKDSFARVQELFQQFEALHGTTDCRSLLGADISTDEGWQKAREQKLFGKVCPAYVRDAAMALEKLLEAHADKRSEK